MHLRCPVVGNPQGRYVSRQPRSHVGHAPGVLTAENVVPLVYKAAIDATVIRTLNAVSARLTMADLLNLDAKVMLHGASPLTVAKDWLMQNGLG
jgi:hypothetical protein